ncbi:MAG: cytochrome c oxidase cbb3-type subunit 4 [Candidatus Azotimanducaceae bacterium]|jgi:cytochrome c oxidase cbb3-type subunit 4
MDIDDLRGLATIFCMMVVFAFVYWAYGQSRKADFEEAGNFPFEEADNNKGGQQ